MPRKCQACEYPMEGEEGTNINGYCDYCDDIMVNGEAESDALEGHAKRLEGLSVAMTETETHGGDTLFVIREPDTEGNPKTDLRRMAYSLRFIAENIRRWEEANA